ncbi:MAG: twin-arginine translocase subunit TatC [Sporolactobacillus sp.]
MAAQDEQDTSMAMMGHLQELRKRIIIVLVVFVASFAFSLFFVQRLYRFLIANLTHIQTKLIVLGPTDIIKVYFMIAGFMAITLTLPVILWQLWRFVAPALTPRERRFSLSYIPFIFLLFVGGVAFGYFVVFPNIFHFLVRINGGMFSMLFTTDKYFGFMVNLVLPFGILFELPVVVVFLTSLGILSPKRMRKMRKMAYLGLVILATMISPPDFVSHSLVAVPLLLLYEVCVSVCGFAYRRRQRRLAAAERELNATV